MFLVIVVVIFWWNVVVFNSCFFFGLVINEVFISIEGIDGDFNIINVVCLVLWLCSLCIGLIFFRICELSVRLFLMVFVCIRLNSICCNRWFLLVVFLLVILLVWFLCLDRYFVIVLFVLWLERVNIEVLVVFGLVKLLVWIDINRFALCLWVILMWL